ncbi:pumilio domain member 6 [Loxospora ochrophaea]|nr:pumilio domain member 6 [Loxospora ochrophaea]
MSGMKRKVAPNSKKNGGDANKKAKKELAVVKKPKNSTSRETETDSDPIVESETSENSGADDGVSWPSDEDEKRQSSSSTSASKNGDREKISTKYAKHAQQQQKPPASTNGVESSTTSKEAHAKQKMLAQERKAAKPNADWIARSKKIWERLRRKSHVPLEERKKLVEELFSIITGRVKDFVFKHDSVRVIQTAVKYANLDQKKMIALELKGEYRALAESKYAKFLIGKLLVHGDKETRDMVVPEFYGHVRRLIRHPEASWILDDIYRGIASPAQKGLMLREWYGAEFAIFRTDTKNPASADLKVLLAANPEKKKPIMRSLHDLVNQLIQKKTTGFSILHDAMLQYFLNVSPRSEEVNDFIELLKGDEEGDLLKNLAFTKSGARLVCLALAHGNAKDRKQILKTYKTIIPLLSSDAHAHQIILAAYDVIDDTVLTSKSVIAELTGNKGPNDNEWQDSLLASTVHMNARIPILYLFAGKTRSILPEEDMMLLEEIHSIRSSAPTSKKDPQLRRKELIVAISPPLLSLIAAKANVLVKTGFGCQFIIEVLLDAAGDKSEALNAVADTVRGDENMKASLDSPAAGRMLKNLVQGGRYDTKTKAIQVVQPPLEFGDIFYKRIRDQAVSWATGPNSFVIVALLEAEGFGESAKLKTDLRRSIQELRKAAGRQAKKELGVEVQERRKKAEGKAKKADEGGNRGTQLLLENLGA